MNLRADPTRTTLIRRGFMSDIARRMRDLNKAIFELVVTEDAFGLVESKPLQLNTEEPITNAGRYAFLTSDKKLEAFSAWLDSQIAGKVLSIKSEKYVESAYRKGLARAYLDVNKRKLSKKPGFYMDSQAQFLKDAFTQPETLAKVRLLAVRTFENMKGLTAQQKTQLNRILADGMANGRGVRAIARDMRERVDTLTKSRAMTIARTEIIHAHAEGQLDAFEELGVESLGVQAEWVTAGDDHVCERCAAMEGQIIPIEEARGKIPLHPNCRCAWVPYVEVPKKKKRRG